MPRATYIVSTGTAEQMAVQETKLLAQGFTQVGEPHGYAPSLAPMQYHLRRSIGIYGSWQPMVILHWREDPIGTRQSLTKPSCCQA
jgi:hypothetical protein